MLKADNMQWVSGPQVTGLGAGLHGPQVTGLGAGLRTWAPCGAQRVPSMQCVSLHSTPGIPCTQLLVPLHSTPGIPCTQLLNSWYPLHSTPQLLVSPALNSWCPSPRS